jgi:hypothetical protein
MKKKNSSYAWSEMQMIDAYEYVIPPQGKWETLESMRYIYWAEKMRNRKFN